MVAKDDFVLCSTNGFEGGFQREIQACTELCRHWCLQSPRSTTLKDSILFGSMIQVWGEWGWGEYCQYDYIFILFYFILFHFIEREKEERRTEGEREEREQAS